MSPLKRCILAIVLFKIRIRLKCQGGGGAPIYFEFKKRRMHYWYRNMQSLRSLPLKKSR